MTALVFALAAFTATAAAQVTPRDLVYRTVDQLPSQDKRWALIIGIDKYVDAQITSLGGAANDAQALAHELVASAGFPEDQVIVLTSQRPPHLRPTRTNILRQLAQLNRQVPHDGLLLFSFAGHGIAHDGQAFLLPADASIVEDTEFLRDTALGLTLIKDRIERINAKQVVLLLDACRNDPAASRSDSPNLMTDAFRDFRFDLANRGVEAFATLFATAVGERAYEYPDPETGQRHGYFTAAVVQGLRGAAANNRGEVTLASLVSYIQTNVPERVTIDLGPSYQQRPFAEINGYRADDLVLAKVEGVGAPPLSENDLWIDAQDSNSAGAYSSYLDAFPQGRFADQAFFRLAEFSESAEGVPLPRTAGGDFAPEKYSFAEYLARFPQGQFADQALWRTIEGSKDPDDYRRYLELHPGGRFAAPARVALEQLIWNQAVAQNSGDGYRSYLDEFPQGVFAPRAKDALVRLDWREVSRSGDLAKLAEFRDRQPDSPYAASAEALIERLEWEQVAASDDPQALQAFLAKHPDGAMAELARVRLDELMRPAGEESTGGSGVVLQPGAIALNPIDRQEYAFIPGGDFRMGCVAGDDECIDDEKPAHTVTISRGFWMGRTETTVQAYRRYAREKKIELPKPTDANPKWRYTDHPITRVTWEQAQDFCRWAGGRLPTEAEWEYAARGGVAGAVYPWPGGIDRNRANFMGKEGNDIYDFTSPVQSFDPNPYGLFDLAGNVWEWAADWYAEDAYRSGDAVDPPGPAQGKEHVIRGGSWYSREKHMRVSARNKSDSVGNITGFRCVAPQIPQ